MPPSAPVPFLRRGDIGEGDSHHLGGHHLGAVSGAFPVNNRGRWWFTWRSLHPGRRMRRPYTDLSTPPRLGCTRRRPFRSYRMGDIREGDSHHLGGHHLGAVSGAFPVNNRGRWWFTWRSLQPGRRVRRPYTDLSTPPRLGCTRRRPFRSSGWGTLEKGTVTIWERRAFGREGNSHHLGGHHLGAVSGAFPVNNRGRWWFTWRSLQPGRRLRRPYTDLSTPPRLGCPRRRPFRSSGEGTLEKGTVII